MNKKEIKEFFRERFPNIAFLRKAVTRKRIQRFCAPMLTADSVRCGEADFSQKERLVEECLAKHPEFVKYTKKTIDYLFERAPEYAGRTDKEHVRIDMLFCRYAYGFQPDEYLCFNLKNKNMEERKAFVSDIDRFCFIYKMNDLFEMPLFNNKARTYAFFKQYYKRDAIAIHSRKDYGAFQDYVSNHPVFVKKAVYESMGRSIELVDTNTCGKTKEQLFNEWISQGLHILEERVVQSPILAALNSSSVNTVRCITMNTRSGIKVAYCFFKVGRNGSFVDNAGAGGIVVGINPDTGVCETEGFDELYNTYKKHPESGVAFKGFRLPAWNDMIALCKEMSAQTPKVKCIGWDMAYTEEERWVVIEGNGMTQMIIPQIVYQRGIKSEVMEYLQDMDLMA